MLGNNKGLTLTELIVTIAIMGVVMLPISLTFFNGYNSFFTENNNMLIQQQAREAIDSVISDLRKNDDKINKITISPDNKKLTISNDIPLITYDFQESQKKLQRNNIDIIDKGILSFKVEEDDTGENPILKIELSFETTDKRVEKLETSYRFKAITKENFN